MNNKYFKCPNCYMLINEYDPKYIYFEKLNTVYLFNLRYDRDKYLLRLSDLIRQCDGRIINCICEYKRRLNIYKNY